MRIGFHAPLKHPDHLVPSGDRQMARALIAALCEAGHSVDVYSRYRSFTPAPDDPPLTRQKAEAEVEIARVAAAWHDTRVRPDLLFSYHLYYKAPDLLGPALARRFALPYVTAEASLSARRATGPWAERQALVAQAVAQARLNLCFTERDREGLRDAAGPACLAVLPPFLDTDRFAPRQTSGTSDGPVQLIALAMMRPGDKLDSYRLLASALALLPAGLPWHLTVVGDGPAREAVLAALAGPAAGRLTLRGALPHDAVPDVLRAADILVWPGLNEAFGVGYLEAQACGVPVVAVRNAGTPSVIRHGVSGLLTDPAPARYAEAVATLITDHEARLRLGRGATAFVHAERGLPGAARQLHAALHPLVKVDA